MANIPRFNLSGADDDEIYRTKTFITELTKVQNDYFERLIEKLIEKLKLEDKESDWMFNYIFNDTSDLSFEDYLDTFDKGEL
jgi:hypothetical protein